ncbi:MAG: hypothetical protein HLX48_02015 [Halomonas sp.]|uniref:hypothetical protein n=1 Tax=Halomonas sp. TaxID=1486246 RepID=UPI0017AA7DE4|nr:hypothetical protein [Halomonas sp.]NWN81759.1 hypothetical protein [Halomonas sp.]
MTTLTLATLPETTAQQVFDHVARHLLKQGAPSMAPDGAGCQYRGDKGRACAAGCLMSDAEYQALDQHVAPDPDLSGASVEGKDWHQLMDHGHVPETHWPLIVALQEVHDEALDSALDQVVPIWRTELRNVALSHGLSSIVLDGMAD